MPGLTKGSSLSTTSWEQWNRTNALLGAASASARSVVNFIVLRDRGVISSWEVEELESDGVQGMNY